MRGIGCWRLRGGYGEVELLEHKSARWLRLDELNEVVWLPADVSVVNSLRSTVDG